jgi:sortase A
MNPSSPNDKRPTAPLVPERAALTGPQIPARGNSTAINAAAAHIVRDQLNSIYNGNTATPTPQTTPVAHTVQPAPAPVSQPQQSSLETENPYERTHSTAEHVQAEQWKQYHSAWQDYYQKYYERYYMGQVYQARQALETRTNDASKAPQTAASPAQPGAKQQDEPETISRDEALYDLRNKLLTQMRTGAKKVRKSRHFVPLAAAICVVVLFLFLQYNRVLIANVQAYISPGDIDPANIIVNPSTNVAVSADPRLIIPKINVDVPTIWNTKPDYDSQMAAMQNGVAWFGIPGANSHPGQVGNTVLSGHSSNDIIDKGDYKFIFARLDHMVKGDSIFINYQGKRYAYTVTKTEVVQPTQVGKLVYKTDKPILTLITCTPLGTSLNRLLVTAEQVSPDPTGATAAPSDSGSTGTTSIPGNSPTFLERIFGGNDG